MGAIVLLSLVFGFIGCMIFGTGGWYLYGNHIFEGTGCFSAILVFGILGVIMYALFGETIGNVCVLIMILYLVFK